MTTYDENETPWFTKDRSETAVNRYPSRTIENNVLVENPALGINLYRNVFSKEDSERYINILESNLGGNGKYKWSEAKVTNSDVPIKKHLTGGRMTTTGIACCLMPWIVAGILAHSAPFELFFMDTSPISLVKTWVFGADSPLFKFFNP